MPTPLTSDLTLMLTRELDGIAREIEAFPDDATIWQVAPGVTNSAGNLALHIAGNMQHFIGTLLGHTGYVRDREREFSQRSGTKLDVLEELARARSVVQRVLPSLPAGSLDATLNTQSMPGPVPAQRLLLHMCAHAGFHLGQIGYLRRIVTGENRSAGPLPVTALFDRV
jgi:uncharacterized damage-inducible protein DinB